MKKDVDWKSFVAELLDKLILTQGELAERLGSAQQTVSNWKNGSRKPGRYAMRKLLPLASEAGLNLKKYGIEEYESKTSETHKISDKSEAGLSTLINLYKKMPTEKKRQVVDFAKFQNLE